MLSVYSFALLRADVQGPRASPQFSVFLTRGEGLGPPAAPSGLRAATLSAVAVEGHAAHGAQVWQGAGWILCTLSLLLL